MTRRTAGDIARLIAALLPVFVAARAGGQTVAITGRVVDAVSRRPVSPAHLQISSPDSTAVRSTYTDQDGRFRVYVNAGTYRLSITAIGYRAWRRDNVAVSPGSPADVSVSMEPLGQWLNPVIVTASRRPEPAEIAPATASTIEARTLEEQPDPTPIARVRDAPGVDVATAGLIQDHVVTRGFNGVFSGALLVLTDNRFDFVPSLRVNAPSLIPATTSDIDHIEVVLGPAAALYGPNAASGVLQIITKSPFDAPGTTISTAALARSANDFGPAGGGSQLTLRHAATVGSHLGYKITADYLRGTDWRDVDTAERVSRDYRVERWSAGGQVVYRPSPTTEVLAAAGRTEVGNLVELTGLGAAQVRDWTLDYYQASLRHGRLFAQAFANVNDAGQTRWLRNPSPISDQSRMYVGQVQYGSDVGARQTFTYGLDAQLTDPRTNQDGRNVNHDAVTEVGGYLQSETHLTPALDLIGAARVDRNDRLPSAVFSPRAAIVFRPGDDQSVRLTYNRAFETPTVADLFVDTPALIVPPYTIRAVGVPPGSGFSFRPGCNGGFCMYSPWPFVPGGTTSPSTPLPMDGTRFWSEIVSLAGQQQWGDLSKIPAPGPNDVHSVLRRADVTALRGNPFNDIQSSDIQNVPPLREAVTNTLEMGYKGKLGDNLHLVVDAYYEWRRDFISEFALTPSVFLDPKSLAAYLSHYMPADSAKLTAARIGGVSGSPDTVGIPIGTVAPEGRFGGSSDVLLTWGNSGLIHRLGADVATQWAATDHVTLTGAYSWTNKLLFPGTQIGGADLALNAPRDRVSLTVQFRDGDRGLSAYLRGRFTGAFPMISGVYNGQVSSYTLADAGAAYRLPNRPDLVVALSATNALNMLHREFVGAPQIGRLVSLRAEYTLR